MEATLQERTPETITAASPSTKELSERFPLSTEGWDDAMWAAFGLSEKVSVSTLEMVENRLRGWRAEACEWPSTGICQCRVPHVMRGYYEQGLVVVQSNCIVPALAARGIPKRLLTASIDTFDATGKDRATALAGAKALLAGRIPGLFLTGSVGTGKTFLSAAILRARADEQPFGGWHAPERNSGQLYPSWDVKWEADPPVYFVNVAAALEARRRAISADDGGKAGRSWGRACYERLVVLDDLGAESMHHPDGRPKEWPLEQLFVLINTRYENELPTVVTSNYTMSELVGRLDARIVDRLNCMVRTVELTGQSRRGQPG